MTEDITNRLNSLEMMVAHQEQMLHELSDVITKQWTMIDGLKRELSRLEATKADIDPEHEGDRRPPHY
ncbi:MAG: SlyX family protein [Rhodospirillales bacterium]|jgi:SlyX protein|nr:SlyX family protein [Rhodospirillales bacterium]